MKLNILCVGDIVGRPGRRILADKLMPLIKEHGIDCVIANAENAAGGSGLTPQIYEKLLKYGVNLITLGDHAYRKREIVETLNAPTISFAPLIFHRARRARILPFIKPAKAQQSPLYR